MTMETEMETTLRSIAVVERYSPLTKASEFTRARRVAGKTQSSAGYLTERRVARISRTLTTARFIPQLSKKSQAKSMEKESPW